MASITINPVRIQVPTSTEITGDEKIIIMNSNGVRSTVSVNQIFNKVDDQITERIDEIDDPIIEKVEEQIDDMIEERLENIDPNNNLKWNEVV